MNVDGGDDDDDCWLHAACVDGCILGGRTSREEVPSTYLHTGGVKSVNLNFNILFPAYTITHCIYSVCGYVIERTLQRTIQWSICNRCH